MKNRVVYLLALLFLFAGLQPARAQPKGQMQPVGCVDPILRSQSAIIKEHFVSQGFVVMRDAMINMSSMEDFPVMVQLVRGQLYQIIFVGQSAATNHKLVIYDGSDNKMDEKHVSRNRDLSEEQTNFLIYEFIPDRTDMYMLTFMSRLKNKDFCGAVSILTADPKKGKIEYKPYQP